MAPAHYCCHCVYQYHCAVLELEIVPRERDVLLGVDAVLVHHVAQVSLAGGQQVVGPGHEPRVLSQTFLLLAGAP